MSAFASEMDDKLQTHTDVLVWDALPSQGNRPQHSPLQTLM